MDAAQATDHQTGSRRLVLPILRIATMSRRLGKRQTALLSALGSLGDAGESHWWKMSAIVNRYYGQSPDIVEREAEIGRRVNADPDLRLARASVQLPLAGTRRYRSRKVPVWFDDDLKPSRTMAALVRRGLVERYGKQSWYRLTRAGAHEVGGGEG